MSTTAAPSSSLTGILRPLWAGLALVLTYNGLLAAWLALRPAPYPVIQAVDNVAQFAGPLLALPLCWGGLAWPWRRDRVGTAGTATAASRWMPVLLGLGVLGYAVGQVIWTYYQEIIHQPPFPSWADAGYLAAYPCLCGGLLLLPRRPLPRAVRLRVLLDGVMMMTGVVAFSWYFVLGPTVLQGSESLFGQFVGAAYPLSMVCMRVQHQLDHAAHLDEGVARYDAVGPPHRAQERPAFRGVGLIQTVPLS